MERSAGRTLLLVEDEAIIALDEAQRLRDHGYAVVVRNHGAAAVDEVSCNPHIDLVLMDIDLGEGMDGTEAAQRILEIREIPIVFLTSHMGGDTADRVSRITRYGFVLKSADDVVILSTIEMAFRLFEAHVEARAREERERHLNAVLRAIRNVNQLITREGDRNTLVRELCGMLVETMGYVGAWIALLDGPKPMVIARAGFSQISEDSPLFLNGEAPACAARALESDTVVVFDNLLDLCAECPVGRRCHVQAGLSRRLVADGKAYGVLTVAVDPCYVHDSEEQALFDEVCGDVAFALRKIEQEEEINLQGMILNQIRDLVTLTDLSGRIVYVNDANVALLKRSQDDLVGASVESLSESPSHGASQREILSRTLQDGEWRGEVVNYAGDGSEVVLDARTWLVRGNDGNPRYLCGVSRDVTARKRAEDELRESRENLSVTLNSIGDAVITTDNEGRITRLNPVAEELTGYRLEEALGRSLSEVFRITNGDTGEPAPNPVTRVLATGRIVGLANHTVLTARDGTRRQVADSAAPILAEDDGIIGVVLVFRDVTEEYAVREALRRSEERYRTLYDSIGDAILITDTTRQILECNEAFCRLFGYESSELVGNTTSAIYASEDEFRSLGSKLATPEPDGFNHVIHFRTKDGRVFPGDTHVFPVTVGDGRIRGFMGIVRDISEQVEAQARIRHLLQDKELLLREVHHRIKNNMNTVAGLLEVQAGHQMPAAAEHQLREARNRILTMMTIYDKLYKSGDFERIDIAGFLTELIREVSESYATEQNAVQVETDIQSFDISSDLSFPLGIIVNELISNAFKYAFPVGTDGLIRVSGVRRSDGTVVVEVADNGVGLSEDQSSGGQSGFGLTLVRGLAAQAQGTVEVVPGTGTTVVVTLPCAAMTPARDVRGS